MEQGQNLLKQNLAKLPDMCYGVLGTTNELIILKKGEIGYWKTNYGPAPSYEEANEWCDLVNTNLGVTRAQRMAMEHGSMFGWDIPAANPDEDINKRI